MVHKDINHETLLEQYVADGQSVGAVSSHTFSKLTTGHTIRAEFEPITFTVPFVDGITGETLDTHPVLTGREDLEHLLPRFTGPIEQVPPMYSAIKIGGQKLYQIARRGGEVERPARPVTIHELELLDQTGPGDYTLRIRCSKGTYVRTLCHDIGQALGCGGCMSSLRRTMAAGFTLDDAVTLDRVQQEGEALLAPLDSLFRQHPAYRIQHPRVDALCRNGNPFTVRQPLPEGLYRVYGLEGEFLCLSRLEGGVMTSLKNFFGA